MRRRGAVAGVFIVWSVAIASSSLFAQQSNLPTSGVPTSGVPTSGTQTAATPTTVAGVVNAVQGIASAPNAPATAPASQAVSPIPALPKIVPGASPNARGAATRPASAAAQPAGPRAAGVNAAVPGASAASADTMLTRLAPQMDLRVGNKDEGGLRLSGTVGIVVMMGLLTLLPTLVLLMTGFTRILIVLNFLRQALGTQNAPPAQMVAALSLILTGFVMAPTLTKVNDTALQPWMNGKMEQGEMMKTAVVPFREFMLKHTRDHDLQVFIDMSPNVAPQNEDQIPLVTLVSAFATSELRTAFQIGFALFLPFIIIDIVVSSVLMSMGMFMLPPAMISLPFKLLLFVLVDGWTLVVQSLVTSFRV
ncbi:MAG: flagellar type III secretion system pore protein FliP [Gemmatimonadota bacterium]|nr:flagellar type III secretion system pore protein FliP [Gemmatimonadota bacterium]